MVISFRRATPQVIKDIRDGIVGILAGTAAMCIPLAMILHYPAENIATVSGFGVLLIKGIAKMFGVSTDEAVVNAEKAIKQVEIDNENKPT